MVLGDSALFTPEAVHTLTHTDFLVVQSMFMSELAEAADVLLPMTSFAEENGVVTSLDRWALRRRAAIDPPGEARPADFTLTELGHRMGAQDFGGHPAPVLQEIREAVPAYAAATDDALDAGGVQLAWAMPERADLTPLHAAAASQLRRRFVPLRAGPCARAAGGRGRGGAQQRQERHPPRGRAGAPPGRRCRHGRGPGDVIDVAANGHRIRGLVRTTGPLRGVVSATVLFGELAIALDQSADDDPMLRVPGLHIMPVQVAKA